MGSLKNREEGRGLGAKLPLLPPRDREKQGRGRRGDGGGLCRPSRARRRLGGGGKARGRCGEPIPPLTRGWGGARGPGHKGRWRWVEAGVEAALPGWGGATAAAVVVVGAGARWRAYL